jgi:hypothetical protein
MILKRYCIDCGKIEPPEGQKCCPDSRVYWVEKEACEKLNEMERQRGKTFDELLAKLTPRELSAPDLPWPAYEQIRADLKALDA